MTTPTPSDLLKIDVLYGFVRMETLWRSLPDGSMESGCRVTDMNATNHQSPQKQAQKQDASHDR